MISNEYRKLLEESHGLSPDWGESSYMGKRMRRIKEWLEKQDSKEVLDYGCSNGGLGERLHGYVVQNYDPGVPAYSSPPTPRDLVLCIDVLEHVEPEHIDSVIAHLYSLTKKAAYIVINIGKANHVLPDGRNAHLIIEDRPWWREKFSAYPDWNVELVFEMSISWLKEMGYLE